MRTIEMRDNKHTLLGNVKNIDLDQLMIDAVDYIDDNLFVELLEASDHAADVSPEYPQHSSLDDPSSFQTDDFEDHLSEDDTLINNRILDRLIMDAVDYLDDDLFVNLLEENYNPFIDAMEELFKVRRPRHDKDLALQYEQIYERIRTLDNFINDAGTLFEELYADCKKCALQKKISTSGNSPFSKTDLKIEPMSSINWERINTFNPYDFILEKWYQFKEEIAQLTKSLNRDTIDSSRDHYGVSYYSVNDSWIKPICEHFLLEDKFGKAFDIPRSMPWKKMLAQCDGNTYLINSYMGKDYIQTYDIMNSFICVPQKVRNRFDMAKITVNNENISSITVPATIEVVYMVVDCCEELVDISFLDFTFKKNSKNVNEFWIEISNCEKLKYIRFPKGIYSISKLLIKDCKSLESIYFPGEVAEQKNNNIFLDSRSCPQISIVSDDDSMREYAEETNIPIRSVAIG